MKDIKRVVVVSYRKLICTMLALAFILSICLPGSFKVNAAGAKNVNEVLASNYSNTYLIIGTCLSRVIFLRMWYHIKYLFQ